MLEKEKLVKQIAKRKGMDERVVRLVADYPLKFVRDKISDGNNIRPIRVRYLGVFALRKKFWKNMEYPSDDVIEQLPLKS